MAEVFTYKRKPGAQGKISFVVREAQFGDGYTQAAEDGLNNARQSWPLTFEGSEAEMMPIYNFFMRHKGAKSFLWTPPGSVNSLLFRVTEFSFTSIGNGIFAVSAEFKQHYVP